MRVIGGQAKGIRLKSIKGIRPISDRAKEGLFNLLGEELRGKRFLDLFAGTGQVGIEALSRGVERVTFVEKDKKVVEVIRENLIKTGFKERCEVLDCSVEKGIKSLHKQNIGFDIIFLGPPQFKNLVNFTLKYLSKYNILEEDGWIIAQHDRREKVEEKYFNPVKQRRYGDTVFSFLVHR
ncbi:MAG: 16S rRNA (guanine(966)-N(2))-methyltransferase RsmD [bacterium]|nr:16S rRNA (guanine(966)-N(2))-methyltransferase RsmD [bacterium]